MKPILFNTEMVRAIIEGRKTVTRRVMIPPPYTECDHGGVHEFVTDDFGGKRNYTGFVCRKCGYGVSPPHCKYSVGTSFFRPKYQPGDILYVRETWRIQAAHRFDADVRIEFKAGGPMATIQFPGCRSQGTERREYDSFLQKWDRSGWHPSIHMPKEAARLFLKVTNVRVERLQDIDEEGAKAEGANFCNGKHVGVKEKMRRSAVERFANIWNKTIKPADIGLYDWDANPWVWVIEYEQCEKPVEINNEDTAR